MDSKTKIALDLSEEILTDLEDANQKLSNIVLKCLRLARIMEDAENLEWLICETQGYKGTPKGIPSDLFVIAQNHGRDKENEKGEDVIFQELSGQLEKQIESAEKIMGSYTTNGASVAGEWSMGAMNNLVSGVARSNNGLRSSVADAQEKLSILRGQYYKYVLNINIQLKFSDKVEDIFNEYRISTDTSLAELIPDSIFKLSSIYSRLNDKDKESWSQAATTCRKLLVEFSNSLFEKLYPNYKPKVVKVKSGKDLDITGDKYLNRLSAVLDIVNVNDMKRDNLLLTVSWLESINDRVCKGLHNDVEYEEIRSTILHLYILLADIVADYKKHCNAEKK